ncbi:hypothetical protein Ddye_008445 [Dipteronia dyeriana]|uniref:Uncharacterized protein n=1 Tax=Dipteronia dyeriana TaxID=168575 RepID=A0AAE0CLX1_9ROSI|nr:hypothetical protein Ddye_008445 [Dipteronia dyeriana]
MAPASTTKHAIVDSSESINTFGRSDSSTSDTEDEIGGDDDQGGVAITVLGTKEPGKSYGWVLRAWKSNMGTYWHVTAFVNEHTCERNDNYNVEFKRVSAAVIGDLFASKYCDPDRIIHPKDIVFEMREQHGIHLSYNKAYRLKQHALNQVFGDLWESFKRLPSYFYALEQANPETVTKIKTDS